LASPALPAIPSAIYELEIRPSTPSTNQSVSLIFIPTVPAHLLALADFTSNSQLGAALNITFDTSAYREVVTVLLLLVSRRHRHWWHFAIDPLLLGLRAALLQFNFPQLSRRSTFTITSLLCRCEPDCRQHSATSPRRLASPFIQRCSSLFAAVLVSQP
jgi:hypothetical protein